jgi:hypothetical protein
MRWEEEVTLLQEEMRRVLAFLQWQATWWTEQGDRWEGLPPDVTAGLCAYAHRQADCRRRLHDHFCHMWREVAICVQLGIRSTGNGDGELPSDNEDA